MEYRVDLLHSHFFYLMCSVCLPARVITANISSLTPNYSFLFAVLWLEVFGHFYYEDQGAFFFFHQAPTDKQLLFFKRVFVLLLFLFCSLLLSKQHFACWILLFNLSKQEFLL